MNTTFMRATVVAGVLVCGLLACVRTPAADPDRVAIESAIQRWTTAVNAHDVAALKSTMSGDVQLSDGAATVTGRDSAIQALGQMASGGKLVVTTREISIAGDIAWHVVGLSQTRKNGDVHALGQALEIWKRDNGEWKLHRRMVADVGAGVSLTRPSTNEPVLDRPAQ